MKWSKVAALDVRIGDVLEDKDGYWFRVHNIDGGHYWSAGIQFSGQRYNYPLDEGSLFVSAELVELNDSGEELLDVVKREDAPE